MSVHKNVRLLAWFNFFTDFKLYAGILIIYFTKITGSLALGMSIFSISSISHAIFEVPTGIFSDRIGRKNTITLGALCSVLYAVVFAIGTSYWILFLGAIFFGLSEAFYSGNNDALLHDSLKETGNKHEYAAYLGKLSSLFQAALAISALIGSIIASYSFSLVIWLSAFSQFICLIISFFITEPKVKIQKTTNIYSHIKDAVKLFIQNKKIRFMSIGSMISFAIGEASFQFQSVFYKTIWPLWAIGGAKTLSYVGAASSFYLSGKIIKKFNEVKILIIGNLYSRIINTISVLLPSVISPILMSSTSLFYGVTKVSTSSYLQKQFTPNQRATMESLRSLGESVLFAILAFLLGLIGDNIGPAKTLFVAQIIALIGTYIYWQTLKLEKKN